MTKNPSELPGDESPADILDEALASVRDETVPVGPSPELIAATHDKLWYPFRSREVRDICRYMTPEETRRLTVYGQRAGVICGVVPSLVLYHLFGFLAFYTPLYPLRVWSSLTLVAIAIPMGLLIGWFGFAGVRKKQIQMLCDTGYARQQGITPQTLRLYEFAGQWHYFLFRVMMITVTLMLLHVLLWTLPRMPGVAQGPYSDDVDPAARQILNRTSEVYAHCMSYQDSGVFKLVILQNGTRHEEEKPFHTAFVRNGRLRYEFQHKSGRKQPYRYIIWSDGKQVRTWWDLKPGIEKPKSLELAFAGVEGAGSSPAIPAFLLPGQVQANLGVTLTAVKLEADEKVDGADCFHITGKYAGEPMSVWIDKQSQLIRKTVKRSFIKDFVAEQTLSYTPIINCVVTDKLLEFNPPVAK